VFQLLFLSFDISYRVLYVHETSLSGSSDNFERRGKCLVRNDLFNNLINAPFQGVGGHQLRQF
jgi:hypothetical protein